MTHLLQYICIFHPQDSYIYFPFCSILVGTNYFSGLCEFLADQSQKAFVVFSCMSLSVTHIVRNLQSFTARLVDRICLQPILWHTEMLLKQSLLLAARHMCKLLPSPDAVAKMNRALH